MNSHYENTPTMGAVKTDSGIVRSLRLAAKRQAREATSPQSEKQTRAVRTKATQERGTKKVVSPPKSAKRAPDGDARKKLVMSALHNLGNTCFMNSVLQVLYRTPKFCEKIHILCSEVKSTMLSLGILEQLNYEGLQLEDHLEWVLVSRLDKLMKQMKKIDDDIEDGKVIEFAAIRPYDLLDSIEEIHSDFQGNRPQDAHELLKCLLMIVDETASKLNQSRSDVNRHIRGISPILIGTPPRVKIPTFATVTDHLGISEVVDAGSGDDPSRADFRFEYCDRNRQSGDGPGVVTSTYLEPQLKVVSGLAISPDVSFTSQRPKVGKEFESPTLSKRNSSVGRMRWTDDEISFKVESPSSLVVPLSSLRFETPRPRRSVRVSLARLDSPRGLRRANIGTGYVANMVTELFQGYSSLATKCLSCGMESVRKEELQEISLPIRRDIVTSTSNAEDGMDGEHVSLLELILSILDEVEQLDCDNLYLCNTCRHLVKAERRLSYELLPDILTIHLKRFASSLAGNFTKTSDSVDIPLELPCLETSCRNKKTPCHRYLLYGIVSHSGKSLLSGHYRAYIRVPPPNKSPAQCCLPVVQLHNIASSAVSGQTMQMPDSKCSLNVSQNICSTPNQDSTTPESSDASSRKRKRSSGGTSARRSAEQGTSPDAIKEPLHTAWYQCNDDVVTALNSQQLSNLLRASGSNTPYMLFYHKITLSKDNLTRCSNQ